MFRVMMFQNLKKAIIKRTIFPVVIMAAILFLSSCSREKPKPNILLITMDTTRQDHLGAYGYPRDTTPFIDSLAKEGLMFKKVVTPIPLTAGSHTSILTSRHPVSHNLILNGSVFNSEVQTIAEVLKKNGYYTIGTISVGLMTAKQGFGQGFDSFSDTWDLTTPLNNKFDRVAESVNKSLYKQIDEYHANHKDKPLFIWVHYFDPHYPHFNRDDINFKTKHTIDKYSNKVNQQVEYYDKEIRYMDRHIRDLYKHLESKGLTRQLVTCLTADHGEQFGEHGYTYGHADFYSETTHVPLIFHGQDIPKKTITTPTVSTLDIATTLLKTAGLAFDYTTDGINLLHAVEEDQFPKKRNFLIIGNPVYNRSIQLFAPPFSYIINFDYHYKHWMLVTYNNENSAIHDHRFKPVKNKLPPEYKYKAKVTPPQYLKKGTHYAILRVDIKNGQGTDLMIRLIPSTFKYRHTLKGQFKHLDILCPVSTMDRVWFLMESQPDAIIENLRLAYITEKEWEQEWEKKWTAMSESEDKSIQIIKLENRVFKELLTQRKHSHKNELYDLTSDFQMEKNLVDLQQHKPLIIKYTKRIYQAFNNYLKKRKNMLKGLKDDKDLTEQDKKMLKSLGYL